MLLEYRPDEVQLVISDNGIGFDPGSAGRGHGHAGTLGRLWADGDARAAQVRWAARCRSATRTARRSWRKSARAVAAVVRDREGSAMIRVLVVDDHPVVRHGLLAILRLRARTWSWSATRPTGPKQCA